jgi:uncharacterized protein
VTLWQQAPGGLRLRVRVQPRSSQNRVVGVHDNAIKLQVTAPPVEGAANAAVAALLAQWLHVPPKSVKIVHGHAGRDKVVMIATSAAEELSGRVENELARLQRRGSERATVVDKARPCD